MRKMNLLHYRALKIMLGIERFSLGIGGYSRLLSLTGSWRLSCKLAVRVICTLARMLMLPPTNPVAKIVVSALASTEVAVSSILFMCVFFGFLIAIKSQVHYSCKYFII